MIPACIVGDKKASLDRRRESGAVDGEWIIIGRLSKFDIIIETMPLHIFRDFKPVFIYFGIEESLWKNRLPRISRMHF